MRKKHYTAEKIIIKLREVEVQCGLAKPSEKLYVKLEYQNKPAKSPA
jgi:hypothetical protein